MAVYHVSINNQVFSDSEDVDARNLKAARADALRGALQIGADEICRGKTFFGAEIIIQNKGGDIERRLLAIGVSTLRSTTAVTHVDWMSQ